MRQVVNVTLGYLLQGVEPKEIDNFMAKLSGTYVPAPGEKPPETGRLRATAADLAALDSLKQTPKDRTI